ncbi:MFS transporter [Glycomyces xiaoerkulensis]|uniref:MFS transporter n=1 Tax=Glycomyces xiaoerkulensis TaxID=2038139 RepID=UPI000C264D5B|nr:MFS transporter [Glycomyces xiaoerkulensis]
MVGSAASSVGPPTAWTWKARSTLPLPSDSQFGSTRRERLGWYAYDWANQPFITTVMTVLGTVYLTRLASVAAGCAEDCSGVQVDMLGAAVPIGSLWAYTTSASVLITVVLLPIVGAAADRSPRKRRMLAGFAFTGSALVFAFVFIGAGSGQYGLAAFLILAANIAYGCSIVVYDSFLPQLAAPDDRDRMSSVGWAFAYLAAAVFLLLNLVSISFAERLGVSELTAVQYGMAATGLWWAGWTVFVLVRLPDRRPVVDTSVSLLRQLGSTLAELRHYPYTLLFLAAFLLYSDGISTVLALVGTYGDQELHLGADSLVMAILLVQFVNFGGALAMKQIAVRIGAYKTVMLGLVGWCGVVVGAYWLPEREVLPFLALGIGLGCVMGGTQALSRSLYSQLIPPGKSAAYFGVYQIADRGTSWIGPLMFGLVVQITGSMRAGVAGLVVFFALGLVLLALVPMRRAIEAVGNVPPHRL